MIRGTSNDRDGECFNFIDLINTAVNSNIQLYCFEVTGQSNLVSSSGSFQELESLSPQMRQCSGKFRDGPCNNKGTTVSYRAWAHTPANTRIKREVYRTVSYKLR